MPLVGVASRAPYTARRADRFTGGAVRGDAGSVNRDEPVSVEPYVDVVQRADEAMIRTLYAEHAGPLLAYVLRLLDGDRQRAEDVVQETLVRAWRHPDALAPDRGDVRPWLWTVARRLVIDGVRAAGSRPREVSDQALAAVPAEDELGRAVESWQVADALAGLSSEHRAVLVETYYRGRSVAEAAVALGIPPGTVKSRCYYALRALRLRLEERGVTS
jgi:RNA polymerase sigma-70 factor (ECF subfamily)